MKAYLARLWRAIFPKRDVVEWVVNQYGELGVQVNGTCHFLYKGRSLIYDKPMHVRPVGKREFGETCQPLAVTDKTEYKKVSLDDSDEWVIIPGTPPAGT